MYVCMHADLLRCQSSVAWEPLRQWTQLRSIPLSPVYLAMAGFDGADAFSSVALDAPSIYVDYFMR